MAKCDPMKPEPPKRGLRSSITSESLPTAFEAQFSYKYGCKWKA